jgi:ferredoxin
MNRYDELKGIFERREYFKVVCGAGNEDAEEVRKLSLVYTLAGANGIDVSANVEVVKSSIAGVAKAYELAEKLDKKIKHRPFINVSIGMRGDPHIRKARVDQALCTHCGACLAVCLRQAITDTHQIVEKRCIGCGDCARVCLVSAVSFFDKRNELKKILPECLKEGTETFELHAIIPDDESVMADWQMMTGILENNFISMCLDRSQLSDAHLIRRIKAAAELAPGRMIVQADGVPMSGGEDDYNTTLQAVAISDVIAKSKLPVMILTSGGTNSKTGELLKMCGVRAHGVAIGTFARKLIVEQLARPDFDSNIEVVQAAVEIAEKLVRQNLECLNG